MLASFVPLPIDFEMVPMFAWKRYSNFSKTLTKLLMKKKKEKKKKEIEVTLHAAIFSNLQFAATIEISITLDKELSIILRPDI